LTPNYRGVLCLLGALTLLGFFVAYFNGGGKVPRYEALPEDMYEAVNHMVLVPVTAGDQCPDHPYQGGYHEYKQPPWDCAKNVITPHRYPSVSGGNISMILHRGWDSMMRPGPAAADWYDSPPPDSDGFSL
jgi:hypothetical protein